MDTTQLGLLACGVLLVVGVPSAAAQDKPADLIDDRDDVSYDAHYVGDKDHVYLDILSASFSYDAAMDDIVLTAVFQDLSRMWSQDEWQIQYYLRVNGTVGEEVRGILEYRLLKSPPGDLRSVELTWHSSGAAPGVPSETVILDDDVSLEPQGNDTMVFRVPRAVVASRADILAQLEVRTFEAYRPAGWGFAPMGGEDIARSDSLFDVSSLDDEPPRENGTTPEPEGSEPASQPTEEKPTSEPGSARGTPTWGVNVLVALMVAALVASRRRG